MKKKPLQECTEILLKYTDFYERALLDNFPYPLWLKDKESRFLAVNNLFARTFGFSKIEELIGKTDFDITVPEMASRYRADDRAVLIAGEGKMIEEQIIEQGEYKWFETYKAPVYDASGILLGIMGFARNISDRKRMEDALRESEERFRLIFEKSSEAIIFAWPNGQIDMVNPAACKVFGCDQDEMRRRGRDGLMDLTDERLSLALKVREAEGSFRGELRCIRINGEAFPVELVSSEFLDTKGVRRSTTTFRDVTERKKIETALQKNMASLRLRDNALSAISQGVLITDPFQNTTYVNPAFERITGYASSEIVGKNCNLLQGPLTNSRTVNEIRTAIVEEKSFQGEILNYKKDGTEFWNELSINPVIDANGVVTQFVGIQNDITERKHVEKKLRDSEAFNLAIFDSLTDHVVVLDRTGVILACNQAWRNFALKNGAGCISNYDYVGLNYLDVCRKSPAIDDKYEEIINAYTGVEMVLEQKLDSFEMEYPCHSSEENRWFRMRVIPLKGSSGGAVIAHQNITNQRESQAELQLRGAALEAAATAMMITNSCGEIEWANGAFLSQTGYSLDEIVGRNPRNLVRSEYHSQDFFKNLWETILAGNVWNSEVVNLRKNKTEFIVYQTITPVRNFSGGISHFISVQQDITDRKKIEKERSEYSERLAELSRHILAVQEEARRRLAGELHDRTSPNLAAMNINIKVATLAAENGNKPELLTRLSDISTLIKDTTLSVRQISTDLRLPVLDYAGLYSAIETYSEQFSKRTGVHVNISCNNQMLRFNPSHETLMFRIFQEALTNVAKHSKAEIVNIFLKSISNIIYLTILDDGIGFNCHNFEGVSGLGLNNMREMASFAGGFLSIESCVGGGTKVHIELTTTDMT